MKNDMKKINQALQPYNLFLCYSSLALITVSTVMVSPDEHLNMVHHS